jgi:hypothetical protein
VGGGCALTTAAGRMFTATVTARVAKLTTRKPTALPIKMSRGGGAGMAVVKSESG